MPKEEKSNNIEYQTRINQVFEALTKGISSPDIFQYVTQKYGWNITERQVYNYIREANLIYKELSEKNKDIEFGKSIARLTMLFEKSLKIQDFKTCLSIQKEINTMFGNYEKVGQNIELTINKPHLIIDWTDSNSNTTDS